MTDEIEELETKLKALKKEKADKLKLNKLRAEIAQIEHDNDTGVKLVKGTKQFFNSLYKAIDEL